MEYGLDANGNGTLDAGEINSSLTKYACNGAAGATGAAGAAGPQGAAGAQGSAGPAGPAGVAGSQGPAGTNGTNGQNSLVKTTIEPAANNCLNGGVKLEYGLDTNGNGSLDAGEINSSLTKYVCNGAAGPQGAAGAQGPAGPSGSQGETGVVNIGTFAGLIQDIPSSLDYVFAGPTATLQISNTSQRISGAGVASLALDLQLPAQQIITGLCYQGSDGVIQNFVGINYTVSRVTTTLLPYSAAASVSNLAPGSYNVGFCVYNNAANVIGANDYANGWVMVTN